MRLNEYQVAARSTAIYDESMKLWYPALGLAGELFEFLEKADDPSSSNEEMRKELGDILWYTAIVAEDAGTTLFAVAGVERFNQLSGCPTALRIELEMKKGGKSVVENIKKAFRDDEGKITPDRMNAISTGLVQLLNALHEYAIELGTGLDKIAEENYAKLKSRQERGKLQGSGDNR